MGMYDFAWLVYDFMLFPNSTLLFRVLALGFKRIKEGKKTHRGWAAKVGGPPVQNVAKICFLIKICIFNTNYLKIAKIIIFQHFLLKILFLTAKEQFNKGLSGFVCLCVCVSVCVQS